MSELDIEALKPLHLTNCDLNSATRLPVCDCQMPAIIAALEDRDRLRAALEQIRDITAEEALTRPGSSLNGILLAVWHHVSEALEGRDG